MKKEQINIIFEVFKKAEPNPKTELEYTNDYTLLVAIALSAQSTDIAVNKATKDLFKVVDTPEKMIKLGEDKLKDYIKTIGLFNSKAKNIIFLSNSIIEKHKGRVPTSIKELTELAGVGNKTANVFLNCFYNVPTIAVDTHVFRVSNRLGIVSAKTADESALKLNKIVDEKYKLHAHHWLILHGRYVCKARKPDCKNCLVNSYCKFFNLVTTLPKKNKS